MSRLRQVHAIGAFLAAVAAGLAAGGLTRAAIMAIAVDLVLFAWSIETLRHHVLTRQETRS